LIADQYKAELTRVSDENHPLMLGQLDGDVIQSQNAALAVIAWPDGTDLAGTAKLVVALIICPDDAGE